ncbi:hypothetical protein [Streptomyces chartreusis]|uniref:hypothetical protein n=1 Tax=Streptomyces chartreusis TaxID=1969 RepID=UPI002E171DDF
MTARLRNHYGPVSDHLVYLRASSAGPHRHTATLRSLLTRAVRPEDTALFLDRFAHAYDLHIQWCTTLTTDR